MGRLLRRSRCIAAACFLSVVVFTGAAYAATPGEAAFVRDGAVWTAAADGTAQQLVLPNAAAPSWSPDGTKLAFERDFQIWVAEADGSGAHVVALNGTHPTWSPDGTQLAYAANTGIWAIGVDGTAERRLTPEPGNPEGPDPQFYGDMPDWAPDGTKIAASGNTYPISYRSIYLVPADGVGFPLSWTMYGDIDTDPAWAPDGTRLAVTVGGHNRAGNVIVADGVGQITPDVLFGDPNNPTEPLWVESRWPAWSPDGGAIAFQSDLEDLLDRHQDLFVYDVATAATTKLADDAGQPDWRTVPAPLGPDCSVVTATPSTLARDGRLHRVTVARNGLRVTVTRVTSDERRGPAWRPDTVRGRQRDVVWLRGEAQRGGDGRTYTITFRGRAGGATCTGTVTAQVPR